MISSSLTGCICLLVNIPREFYEKLDGTDSIKFEKTIQKLVVLIVQEKYYEHLTI